MLKRIGVSVFATAALLLGLAAQTAQARVRFGVQFGQPRYVTPYPVYSYPYYYDYYGYPRVYYYSVPRYVAPYYGPYYSFYGSVGHTHHYRHHHRR